MTLGCKGRGFVESRLKERAVGASDGPWLQSMLKRNLL